MQLFFNKVPTLNLDLLRRLPSIGTVRISAVNYLLQEDMTPIAKFLLRLIVNPKDFIIPGSCKWRVIILFPLLIIFFTVSAVIAQSEIFTLDGKVYYLPAENCHYVLAADAVNGNFSVVGGFQNKLFNEISLTDKSGTFTLTKGKLTLDNGERNLWQIVFTLYLPFLQLKLIYQYRKVLWEPTSLVTLSII